MTLTSHPIEGQFKKSLVATGEVPCAQMLMFYTETVEKTVSFPATIQKVVC